MGYTGKIWLIDWLIDIPIYLYIYIYFCCFYNIDTVYILLYYPLQHKITLNTGHWHNHIIAFHTCICIYALRMWYMWFMWFMYICQWCVKCTSYWMIWISLGINKVSIYLSIYLSMWMGQLKAALVVETSLW